MKIKNQNNGVAFFSFDELCCSFTGASEFIAIS